MMISLPGTGGHASEGVAAEGAATGPAIGLVVNPIAGLGARVALKGSDGTDVQARARELGAAPAATGRAALALMELMARLPPGTAAPRLLTAAGAMGEDAVHAAGLSAQCVYDPGPGPTSAADTARAVAALLCAGVGLLLFAGGDGTARDILDAMPGGLRAAARASATMTGSPRTGAPDGILHRPRDSCGPRGVPVVGIPAGVKMHSAVFGVHPRAAGQAAAAWTGGRSGVKAAEVMDRNEEALRAGRVVTRLYGWLTVPDEPVRIQQRKMGSSAPDADAVAGIAAGLAERVGAGALVVLGPGTTTRAVAAALGAHDATLAGVDVLRVESAGPCAAARVILADARADQLLAQPDLWIALSPIGGQGFLLGRGNQQVSPDLLRTAGRERLAVLATEAKLAALGGRPLLVDTGDPVLDEELSGYVRVITGRRSSAMHLLSP
ncbi:ATP-NAD kinase [Streptomyces longwoodensis]|uniref:ATP-NAD kinase family protein n=1 Tax=Streptomyces longwoodensis TaxID=68231 RepID=UPI000A5A2438|nr:ATP-NAD kinase [Streptomyces longwoodensis]MCX5000814.1 ATP-NAD kinase [Streptomyces longwoodensis]